MKVSRSLKNAIGIIGRVISSLIALISVIMISKRRGVLLSVSK